MNFGDALEGTIMFSPTAILVGLFLLDSLDGLQDPKSQSGKIKRSRSETKVSAGLAQSKGMFSRD